MKKLLLTLGSIAAVAAPVASVVACGAPTPIKLDKSKVEAQLPAIRAALNKAMSGANFNEGVVSPSDGGFKITFTPAGSTTDHMVITVTPDGDITDVKAPTSAPVGTADNLKTQIQSLMTEATHETIRTKQDFDISDYDADVIKSAGSALVVPQDTPAKPSNDEIKTFNDQVDAFQPAYEQELSKQTAAYFKTIAPLTIGHEAYITIGVLQDKELDDALISALGIPADKVTKIKKYIADGAKIIVGIPTAGSDMSGDVLVNGEITQFSLLQNDLFPSA